VSQEPPPKLREDLVAQRRVFGGEAVYVVKDPLRLKYWTVDEFNYTLLSLCDGKRELHELVECGRKMLPGADVDFLMMKALLDGYKDLHFFEDPWERNILLIERKRAWRATALRNAKLNPFEITLPAWNPNRFFDRVVGHLSFLFTGKAVVVYVAMFVAAMWITLANASDFALPLAELYVMKERPVIGIATLWVILFFSVVLHEFGHGLTCKHYGGGVYKIGFLLLYFNPCLYCDTTEAYFFENKRQRYLVALAGGVVDLTLASLATFVWYLTARELFVNQVAHRIAIFSGISGVLVNFNPLMKFDGYYVLSDYVEMPNLQADSFRFLGHRMRRLFGLAHEPITYTPRQRRVFGTYGTLSVLYVVLALTFITFFVGGWLVDRFGAVGYVPAVGFAAFISGRYIKRLVRFARFVALDKIGHLRRYGWLYAAAGLALLALLLWPLPRHVRGGFTLRPGQETIIRSREAGLIESVYVEEGQWVRAGTRLMTLREDRLELHAEEASAVREGAEATRAAAFAARDLAETMASEADARAGAAMERYYRSRAASTRIVAPFDGVVLTPRLDERIGASSSPGDVLCEIGDVRIMRAEVLLDEKLLGLLDDSPIVELRMWAEPGRRIEGRLTQIAPLPSAGELRRLYRVLVEVDNERGELRPGMTGYARFSAGRASLAKRAAEGLARSLRAELWL